MKSEFTKCSKCGKEFQRVPGNTWDRTCYQCRKREEDDERRRRDDEMFQQNMMMAAIIAAVC